jgi:hypothetical protein
MECSGSYSPDASQRQRLKTHSYSICLAIQIQQLAEKYETPVYNQSGDDEILENILVNIKAELVRILPFVPALSEVEGLDQAFKGDV